MRDEAKERSEQATAGCAFDEKPDKDRVLSVLEDVLAMVSRKEAR